MFLYEHKFITGAWLDLYPASFLLSCTRKEGMNLGMRLVHGSLICRLVFIVELSFA